ncbi:hypothetical protein I4U23_005587 [Adineta vaga]|nr:hypothetical protein I4U23_005587 [Adineta vaga]
MFLLNIRKLSLKELIYNEKDLNLIHWDENFHTMQTTNKTIDVEIKFPEDSFEGMKQLVLLFPRMEKLTLSMYKNISSEIVEYLLS